MEKLVIMLLNQTHISRNGILNLTLDIQSGYQKRVVICDRLWHFGSYGGPGRNLGFYCF